MGKAKTLEMDKSFYGTMVSKKKSTFKLQFQIFFLLFTVGFEIPIIYSNFFQFYVIVPGPMY